MTTPEFPTDQPHPFAPPQQPGGPGPAPSAPPAAQPAYGQQPMAYPQQQYAPQPQPQYAQQPQYAPQQQFAPQPQFAPLPQSSPFTPQPAAASDTLASRFVLLAMIALGLAFAFTLAQAAFYLTLVYGPPGGFGLDGITPSTFSIVRAVVLVAALILSIIALSRQGSAARTRTLAFIALGASGYALASSLTDLFFWN